MMVYSKNIESLKTFKVPYFSDNLFRKVKKKPVVNYGKKFLQVGRKTDGSVYTLDLTEACRILLLGATRSGKTFFLRSMADRLNLVGYDLVFLSDVKNEFFSSRESAQEKFHYGLLPGEKPRPMKVVTLRPTFFKSVSNHLADKNFWYSVDMPSLTKADFLTLMNVEDMSATQKIAVDMVYEEMSKRLKLKDDFGDVESFSMDLIYDIIDDMDELTSMQKGQLKFKFKPLEQSSFFEVEFQRSIVSLLRKGYVVSINMENFDSFGSKGAIQFPETTLGIILREVIVARRAKKIKKLWVMLDEASRFVGVKKKSSLKADILQSVDLDSKYGINYCLASQTIDDVPQRILKQCKYIFIPATADVSTIKSALINTGMVRNVQRSVNKAIEVKRKLKSVRFSWMAMNRMNGEMDLIVPLPVLSNHLETSK